MDAWALFWFRWWPAAALLVLAAGVIWRGRRGAAAPGFGELPRPPRGSGLPSLGLAARFRGHAGLNATGPLHWLARQALCAGLALLFLRHLGLAWPALGREGAWWQPLLAAGGPLTVGAAYALTLRRLATPLLRRHATPGDYLWPAFGLIVLASGLALARLDGPAWPLAPGAAPGLGVGLHLVLGWSALALWPWTRWGLGPERLGRWLVRHRPAAAPPAAETPAAWETWQPADYHAWLQRRWAGAGVHQVMGAGRRNRSVAQPRSNGGEADHAG